MPKYPDVRVKLVGEDGNAFAIIAAVNRALRREVGREAAAEFMHEAMRRESYDALLRFVMETVEVE